MFTAAERGEIKLGGGVISLDGAERKERTPFEN